MTLFPPEDSIEKKEKKGCMIVAIILVCILTAIIAGLVWIDAELRLHTEVVRTRSKIGQVGNALHTHLLSYGCYPPQQDMESLLKTLGLKDSEFQNVRSIDIKSAEYHAPAEDSNDPEDRLVTVRTKRHWFDDYDNLRFVRRDGSVGVDSLKDKAQR